jgi:hypothetical protein
MPHKILAKYLDQVRPKPLRSSPNELFVYGI